MALKLLFLLNVVLYVDPDKATALLEKRGKKNREQGGDRGKPFKIYPALFGIAS